MFEVAMLYNDRPTMEGLNEQGFRAAAHVKKSYPIMYEKHFQKYTTKYSQTVHKDIQMYGVDHRTSMNYTPLMAAIHVGNVNLIHEILEMGPSLEVKDSRFRNPLQLAIYQTIDSEKNLVSMLATVYHRIALDSISLDIDGHLVKIDVSRAEYLLFNLILTFYTDMISYQIKGYPVSWTQRL